MEKKAFFYIFLIVFLGMQLPGVAQYNSAHPPEPILASGNDVPGSDCVGESNGSGPSVPVGLCLPINDYLFPLLISGVALGAFSLYYLQQKEVIMNSSG